MNFKIKDLLPKFVCIYLIKNQINGKIYIGKALNLRTRFCGHRHSVSDKLNKTHIANAFRKYGFENFEVKILEHYPSRNPFIEKYILERESFWIRFYQSYKRDIGYNLCEFSNDRSGMKFGPLSDEHRKKIRESKLGEKNPFFGRKVSEEHKRKMKKLNSGKNNFFYGKKHSDEVKKIISEKAKGRKNSHSYKPVRKICPKTNMELQKFPSIKHALLHLGLKETSKKIHFSIKNHSLLDGVYWELIN